MAIQGVPFTVLFDARGLRAGYAGGTRAFLFCGPAEGIPLAELYARPKSRPTIAYYDLEFAYSNGCCPHCGSPATFSVDVSTDCGQKRVLKCERCGGLSRPLARVM